MYLCSICSLKCLTINQLILHLKIYHHYGSQSVYTCRQDGCITDVRGSDKFRKHLMKFHTFPVTTDYSIEVNNLGTSVLESSDTIYNHFTENEQNQINNSVITLNNSSTSYKNIVTKSVLQFITNLYKKPTVTETLMQEIVDGVSDLFSSGIVLFLKNMVMSHLKGCSISEKNEIDDLFDTLANPFLNFKTEYHRFKFFEANNLFFKPKTIVIGHTIEKKNYFRHRSTNNGTSSRTFAIN